MRLFTALLLSLMTEIACGQTSYIDPTLQENSIQEHDKNFYEANTKPYVYKDENGVEMPYRLFLPPNYNPEKKYPLVLYLHGAGSRGNDNLKQLRSWVVGWMDDEVQQKNPCIILMPQCPKNQKWVNVPWKKGSYKMKDIPVSKPMELAKNILDKIVVENAVDKKRIYVMGCSMGGYGTWNFAMRYHKTIAAAVPICGAGDPSMSKKIRKTPIWAFHGNADLTVPLSGSTDMSEALYAQKKNKARLTIYKDVGHNSYEYAWKNPELIDWIFSQKK